MCLLLDTWTEANLPAHDVTNAVKEGNMSSHTQRSIFTRSYFGCSSTSRLHQNGLLPHFLGPEPPVHIPICFRLCRRRDGIKTDIITLSHYLLTGARLFITLLLSGCPERRGNVLFVKMYSLPSHKQMFVSAHNIFQPRLAIIT
jgi:hypothetical protein